MAQKNISIRIDEHTLNKLHVAAAYEARSLNGQLLILIRDYIKQFEAEHGSIGKGR